MTIRAMHTLQVYACTAHIVIDAYNITRQCDHWLIVIYMTRSN